MPKRYTDEEMKFLRELVKKHGRDGLTWADVGNAFRARHQSRPFSSVIEKAKTIKYQARKARDGYADRDRYVSVLRSDLIRWRTLGRQLAGEITALIGHADDDGDG